MVPIDPDISPYNPFKGALLFGSLDPQGNCSEHLTAQSGFRVEGLGLQVEGLGLRLEGLGFRIQGSGFRVQGF